MSDQSKTQEQLARDLAKESTRSLSKKYELGDLDDAFALFDDELSPVAPDSSHLAKSGASHVGLSRASKASEFPTAPPGEASSSSEKPKAGPVQSNQVRYNPRQHEASDTAVESFSAPAANMWEEEKTEVLIGDEPAAPHASLVDQTGRAYEVLHFPFVIGRSADCDLVLSGKGISRRHAEIEFSKDGFQIRDLKSLNGMRVNGETVANQVLHESDEIRLGTVSLKFQTQESGLLSDSAYQSAEPQSSVTQSTQMPYLDSELPEHRSGSSDTHTSPDKTSFLLKLNVLLIGLVIIFGGIYMLFGLSQPAKTNLVFDEVPISPRDSAIDQVSAQGQSAEFANRQTSAAGFDAAQPKFVGQNTQPPLQQNQFQVAAEGTSSALGTPAFDQAESAARLNSVEPVVVDRVNAAVKPEQPGEPDAQRSQAFLELAQIEAKIDQAKKTEQAQIEARLKAQDQLNAQAAISRKQLEASDLLASIESAYLNADKLESKLASINLYSRDLDLTVSLRRQLGAAYDRYSNLLSGYEAGLRAFQRDQHTLAFERWATFLKSEKKAFGGAKESLFAKNVKRNVVTSLKQEAADNEEAGRYHQAYKLWQKAVEVNQDPEATARVIEINDKASALYQAGVDAEQAENFRQAGSYWKEVVALVPSSHEFHTRASAKLTFMREWGNL